MGDENAAPGANLSSIADQPLVACPLPDANDADRDGVFNKLPPEGQAPHNLRAQSVVNPPEKTPEDLWAQAVVGSPEQVLDHATTEPQRSSVTRRPSSGFKSLSPEILAKIDTSAPTHKCTAAEGASREEAAATFDRVFHKKVYLEELLRSKRCSQLPR